MSPSLSAQSISIVIPMRNCEHEVTARLIDTIEKLLELGIEDAEIVVVDDGSTDGTREQLARLPIEHANVRLVRHDRPRGMESAGQTGLERASGTLVFILESQLPIRLADLRQLLRMSEDSSIVAARTESHHTPPSTNLIRRLRAWGTNADCQFDPAPETPEFSSIQWIRRAHLNTLAGPKGRFARLESKTQVALER